MKNTQASMRDFMCRVHFTVDLIILKKEIELTFKHIKRQKKKKPFVLDHSFQQTTPFHTGTRM